MRRSFIRNTCQTCFPRPLTGWQARDQATNPHELAIGTPLRTHTWHTRATVHHTGVTSQGFLPIGATAPRAARLGEVGTAHRDRGSACTASGTRVWAPAAPSRSRGTRASTARRGPAFPGSHRGCQSDARTSDATTEATRTAGATMHSQGTRCERRQHPSVQISAAIAEKGEVME